MLTRATGTTLKDMLAEAAEWLRQNVSAVNALNVFPVPDGDTGTNMHHTMLGAMATVQDCPEERREDASQVARAAAHGALLSARGNSGVILSQILRGLAQGLEGQESFGATELSGALALASEAAYRSVGQPVEGTMLTVIKRAAEAAKQAAEKGCYIDGVLERALQEAKVALAETPEMLPVLKEAGVVDAGGQGLCLLLEGALFGLKGEVGRAKPLDLGHVDSHWLEGAKPGSGPISDSDLGFCTEFLVEGSSFEVELVERRLATLGTSVLVAVDATTMRVHLHTLDPKKALEFGASIGKIVSSKIEDMDEQRRHFLEQARAPGVTFPIAVVAVSPGPGLDQVFRGLGATVVPGGQSMNPSVQEILAALEEAKAQEVLLLPNNPNVIMTANAATKLSSKRVVVVPSRTVPQGVSAMMAWTPEKDIEANGAAMASALQDSTTGEVTTATRDATLNDVKVLAGKPIGLLDGELVVSGETEAEVVIELLKMAEVQMGTLVTLYYGEDVSSADAEAVCKKIKNLFQEVEVEVVYGGQPHYSYILSIES